jgi:hypothetical protein
MRYVIHSFRHGEAILSGEIYKPVYQEVLDVIKGISDDDLKEKHGSFARPPMSLSKAINDLLKERFMKAGWKEESPIFQETEYEGERWRLDFAKAPLSIEVAFNHGEAIAWNLLKPVLASELNHVQKAIQTEAGIIITATAALKAAGGFDSAVGEYEKFIRYLKPLSTVLTVPMVIIGLEPPDSFTMKKTLQGNKHTSEIL